MNNRKKENHDSSRDTSYEEKKESSAPEYDRENGNQYCEHQIEFGRGKNEYPFWKHLIGQSYTVAALCGGMAFLASVETGLVFLVAYGSAILLFSPYYVLEYFLEWNPAKALNTSGRLYINALSIVFGFFLFAVKLFDINIGPHQPLEWYIAAIVAMTCALTIPSPMPRREIQP